MGLNGFVFKEINENENIKTKKNIGRNPIVDCERNGERIENETRVQLENANKSLFTNWK